jgi:ATP-dependent exoDNAse (exonuclease V) beta subunit
VGPFVAKIARLIDLLFGHEGDWWIVDYKADVTATDLASSYREQSKMYLGALACVGIHDVTTAIQRVSGAGE